MSTLYKYMLLFGLVSTLYLGGLKAQTCAKVKYGLEEGVSLPYRNAFIDSKGGLWMGSRGGGLNYFDGKKWRNYTTEDGLLFNWTSSIREDKEGGIWIPHPYAEGATRYINGEFKQYAYLSSPQDTLLEGQYRMPAVVAEKCLFFIDKASFNFQVMGRDSTGNVLLYNFDFASQNFEEGIPFFERKIVYQYKDLLKTSRISITDIKNRRAALIYDELSVLKRILFQNGELWTNSNTSTKKLATPFNSPAEQIVRIGEVWYKMHHDLQVFERISIEAPSLRRYGKKYEDLPLIFYRARTLAETKFAQASILNIWKVNHSNFPNHFVLSEHNSNTGEVIQTLLLEDGLIAHGKLSHAYAKDKLGTLWYTDGNDIVRLFPDQLILSIEEQDLPSESWGIAGAYGDKLYFSTHSLPEGKIGIYAFDGFYLSSLSSSFPIALQFNDTGVRDGKGFSYFPSASRDVMTKKGKKLNFGIFKFNQRGEYEILCPNIQGLYLGWDRKGNLLYGTNNLGLWILSPSKRGVAHTDWKKLNASKGLQLFNVLTALEDQHGQYWMGRGSQGFAVYLPQQDTIYNWIIKQKTEHFGVQSMDEDSLGNLWLGTNKGLYFFENSNPITKRADFYKHRPKRVALDYIGNSMIQVCKVYDKNTLIIGNKKGVFLLDLKAWYATPQQLFIQPYDAQMGNTTGEINQNGVYIDQYKDVWLSGNKGMLKLKPHLLQKDTSTPILHIDSLKVGQKVITSFDKKIKLSSTERTLRIYFSHMPNPLYHDNIYFRHRLSTQADWSELKKTSSVLYSNLAAGSYEFEILAEKNGLQSEVQKISFRISPVLWRHPLFWLLILVSLASLAVYYRKKEHQTHQQELLLERKNLQMANLTKEKEKLKVQAIVNQLNPHFINNALQWLQIRLDDNDDHEAVSVVAKLSQNISTVFKNSRNNKAYHTLWEEMMMVHNYLFIQKRRFKEELQCSLPSKSSLEKYEDITIPLLMIQIHVENAVEHGIRNRKEGGYVNISIREDDLYLFILIEDNGVGRKVAQSIGSNGTQNGIKMLKELQEIFNKQNKWHIQQTFEDDIFTNEKGEKHGTRMTIQLPRTYTYEL